MRRLFSTGPLGKARFLGVSWSGDDVTLHFSDWNGIKVDVPVTRTDLQDILTATVQAHGLKVAPRSKVKK